MRKILVFLVFIIFSYLIYTNVSFDELSIKKNELDIVTYFDGFETLDREMWYVGEWETHESAYNKVFLEDNVITIPVKETDRGPYLLSKPIPLDGKDIIKIKRRTRIKYGSDYFAGGLVVFETDQDDFKPDSRRGLPFGNAVILVEYAHDQSVDTQRPGTDAFRLLAPDWETNKNYVLAEPIFDEWFVEELIINTYNGRVTYIINGKDYTLKSIALTKPYIRIWMHAYGEYTGHQVEIDYFELKLTTPENESIERDMLKEDKDKEKEDSTDEKDL
ncbi:MULTISPECIES: hypothetical protein [unclassified Fusibacter]|uniref:hypothetical protein n=1 Tax=unclassified Fusibacter TaxID=2624464 RepID=UPI0010136403|nr:MULTISPECIES: hypothetical protein [unclassified Fusibacter]MCK8061706.1 hypothetical protein [Fusibacter sp. A2]NPE23884.1 hypothetical protein [Fusibacter sp. A1]RXV58508.1 hypothetical protein DWB64_19040 [Fusibacter sp. A1]